MGDFDDSVSEMKRRIRERLFNLPGFWPNVKSTGDFEQIDRLHDVIKRSVTLGESNSILIVGPRASGKSRLLNMVLEDLKKSTDIRDNLLEVHLNGLLQTDDRLALREIARQLQLETVVGQKVFVSFAENLQFLLESLSSGDQESKTVLFVLDEFDLFSHHKNQTLLYNLFDIAQQAQTPLCVVGLTARHDVMELLEKRVKSRFSHRHIYLLNSYTLHDYVGMFRDYLTLDKDFLYKSYRKEWNKRLSLLCDDPAAVKALKQRFSVTKDIRSLQLVVQICLCKVRGQRHYLEPVDVVEACQYFQEDSKTQILQGISILELCLIIAMKHLDDVYVGEPANFEMIYKEFEKFARTRSSMQMFDKAVILKAFEHLQTLELVKCGDNNNKLQKEYRPVTMLVSAGQIEDVLQRYPNCPTDVIQWFKTPIIG